MSDKEKAPKKQLESSRGGAGGRRKTAIGTQDWGSAPQPLAEVSPVFDNMRAMLVEKHMLISFGLKRVLSHLVSVIAEAHDIPQAWEMARRLRTEIIVTELNFEDDTALDFCRKVKNELPSRLIVATDLHHATRYYHRLRRLGVSGLCLKYNPFALFEAIAAAAQNKQYFEESISALVQQSCADTTVVLSQTQLDVLLRSRLGDSEIANEIGCDLEVVEQTVASLCKKFDIGKREELTMKAVSYGLQPLPIDVKVEPETGVSYEQTASELLAETAIAQEHLRALVAQFRLLQ